MRRFTTIAVGAAFIAGAAGLVSSVEAGPMPNAGVGAGVSGVVPFKSVQYYWGGHKLLLVFGWLERARLVLVRLYVVATGLRLGRRLWLARLGRWWWRRWLAPGPPLAPGTPWRPLGRRWTRRLPSLIASVEMLARALESIDETIDPIGLEQHFEGQRPTRWAQSRGGVAAVSSSSARSAARPSVTRSKLPCIRAVSRKSRMGSSDKQMGAATKDAPNNN